MLCDDVIIQPAIEANSKINSKMQSIYTPAPLLVPYKPHSMDTAR